MIERYELVDESGGAGTWRGGLGLRRVYRPIGHAMTFSGQGERCVNPPPGLFGGEAGATGSFTLHHGNGTVERLPGKPPPLEVPPASAVTVVTPGAGGYGPPEGRDRAKLAEDLASGKFSTEFLQRHYGYRGPSEDGDDV